MSQLLQLARKAWNADKRQDEYEGNIFSREYPEDEEEAAQYLRVNRPLGDPRWCKAQGGLIRILNCGRIQNCEPELTCFGCEFLGDSRALSKWDRHVKGMLRDFPEHCKKELKR